MLTFTSIENTATHSYNLYLESTRQQKHNIYYPYIIVNQVYCFQNRKNVCLTVPADKCSLNESTEKAQK